MLGFDPGDRVQPAQEERRLTGQLDSEEAAIQQALESNREIRRLESNLQAKNLEAKSYQAERLPRVELVAQYSLLSKYNNYEKFFGAFQRHNVELGASFTIPILTGRSGAAYISQTQADIDKIRTQIGQTRGRITADLQHAYREIRRTETAQKLARADLDLARDQLTLDLTRYDEGQVTMAQVEASRAAEQEKWIVYYDTQHALEVARLTVLRQTGTLVASLRQGEACLAPTTIDSFVSTSAATERTARRTAPSGRPRESPSARSPCATSVSHTTRNAPPSRNAHGSSTR